MAGAVLRAVAGVGRFLYGFVVGDDWRAALAMLLALVITALFVVNGVNAWYLVPLLAVVMTGVSLRRQARR